MIRKSEKRSCIKKRGKIKSKMKSEEYEYGCFYLTNYNPEEEPFPDSNKKYDILLRYKLKDENKRVISSLEGLFAYDKPLLDENGNSIAVDNKIVIKRSEMDEFAKKYKGEFIPCVCGEE